MNDITRHVNGGPAFPNSTEMMSLLGGRGGQGMSLLDYFAGQALLGILSGPGARDGVSRTEWFDAPETAYALARKMIEISDAYQRAESGS